MRFLMTGPITAQAAAALAKHEHAGHALAELSAELPSADSPEILLPLLEKKQWNLLTADADFIRRLYDTKIPFNGVIVLILQDPAAPQDQGEAIDRLFERYRRLTPRRLYTITPSRVKIRQLPGGHAE